MIYSEIKQPNADEIKMRVRRYAYRVCATEDREMHDYIYTCICMAQHHKIYV